MHLFSVCVVGLFFMKTLTVGVFHKEILSYSTPFCVNNFPLSYLYLHMKTLYWLAVVLIFDLLLGPALIDMVSFSLGCSSLLPLLHFVTCCYC